MNSVVLTVLVYFVAFAAGADGNATLKVVWSLKSTRDLAEDLIIIDDL